MTGLSPASTAAEILAHLQSLRNETDIAGMARFGIVTDRALGISNPVMQTIGRAIKKNHARAFALWATGIREARLLAIYTFEAKRLTAADAMRLAADFDSWEIVDSAADLFVAARLEAQLVPTFAADDREFVRRAAFAMMASGAVHLKGEPDAAILAWLDLIARHASDPRNFVRKAVNWALRNIGKRNIACHAPALALAEKLAASGDKTERWIGKDAARELRSPAVLARLQRKIAGPAA